MFFESASHDICAFMYMKVGPLPPAPSTRSQPVTSMPSSSSSSPSASPATTPAKEKSEVQASLAASPVTRAPSEPTRRSYSWSYRTLSMTNTPFS
ncbi:hypothetical protein FRB93_009844 [Tulasnella sp. JGI-2019a]|nr:hypothetical protein FRB93_009844 [Tulasnella sp. JGI-2019a]